VLPAAGPLVPAWVDQSRELLVCGVVVKRFRVAAAAQERILAAFQEHCWPEWLDDPLPRSRGRHRRLHLKEAIANLNRNQRHRLLRFQGDGTGKRIGWEFRGGGVTPELHHG
jgi:hypothetical protein